MRVNSVHTLRVDASAPTRVCIQRPLMRCRKQASLCAMHDCGPARAKFIKEEEQGIMSNKQMQAAASILAIASILLAGCATKPIDKQEAGSPAAEQGDPCVSAPPEYKTRCEQANADRKSTRL